MLAILFQFAFQEDGICLELRVLLDGFLVPLAARSLEVLFQKMNLEFETEVLLVDLFQFLLKLAKDPGLCAIY